MGKETSTKETSATAGEPNLKINKVVRMAQAFINERLRGIGLSSGLFYFILELMEHDDLSMQALSRAVLVDNGHTSRAVERLVRLGYVTRKVDPRDSRSFRVSLTKKGRQSSAAVKAVLLEWSKLVSADVAEEEIAVVYRVFDRYYANAAASFETK